MRFFALTQPGFGVVLADEVGGTVLGSDGKNDVVSFETKGGDPTKYRCAEDVFVECGASTSRDLRRLPNALTRELDRALSVYGRWTKPLKTRETVRTIVRVRSERDFLRTELRDAMTAHLAQTKPRWRYADPSSIEVWTIETEDGFHAGIKLGRGKWARNQERHGALRPSIAAAMVRLAGEPADGTGSTLLDPFCGTGTIVFEARIGGWIAFGSDIDREAVAMARVNATAPLVVADALRAPYRSGSVDAIVANLPFGKQYEGPPAKHIVDALRPIARRRLVLLTARGALKGVKTQRELRVQVLGQPASCYVL